jgi:hypothetical protein
VALVRSNDSEELSPSFIRVTRIGELGTTLAVMKEALNSSETSILTRATWRNILEDVVVQYIHLFKVFINIIKFQSSSKQREVSNLSKSSID